VVAPAGEAVLVAADRAQDRVLVRGVGVAEVLHRGQHGVARALELGLLGAERP
jgi:hypothetical protein